MADGNHDSDDGRDMHDALYRTLIDKIRRDRYPSSSMMNLIEAGMSERQRREYLDALLEKASDDQFPSLDLLRRLAGLV